MLWIGLTGGIASGKSTVAKFLEELGICVIYADKLAHEVFEINNPNYIKIKNTFSDCLDAQGNFDRKKIANHVFKDVKLLKILESIVHPHVQSRVAQEKSKLISKGVQVAVYEVPLLFEKKLEKNFDRILLVYVSNQVQLERLINRNNLSREEAEGRISAQVSLDEKLKRADDIINNDGSVEDLKIKVEDWLSFIKGKYNLTK